jgi:hypothetical protein
MTEPLTPDGPLRIADTLNRFTGALHAARCTAVIWIRNAENAEVAIAAKYGLQMTFGTTVLVLRKFQDLWRAGHLQRVIREGSEAWSACEWICNECDAHKTRDAANLLFAHYAKETTDLPLSGRQILALVEAGGWVSEEAVIEWVGPVIDKLRLIRDEIMGRYGISRLTDEEASA